MELVNSTGGAYRTNEIARLLAWTTEGVETGGFVVEVLLLPDDLGTLRDDFYGVARPDDAELKRLGLRRIHATSGSVGWNKDVDYLITARNERFERFFRECRLTDEHNPQLSDLQLIPRPS